MVIEFYGIQYRYMQFWENLISQRRNNQSKRTSVLKPIDNCRIFFSWISYNQFRSNWKLPQNLALLPYFFCTFHYWFLKTHFFLNFPLKDPASLWTPMSALRAVPSEISGICGFMFMFMLAIECDQNVRTFWLCFTLNHQPAVEEPVSVGPEIKTHFTFMFYSTLHLTVRYTLQYVIPFSTLHLTVPYTIWYVIPHSTLYHTVRYTLQYFIHYSTLHLT